MILDLVCLLGLHLFGGLWDGWTLGRAGIFFPDIVPPSWNVSYIMKLRFPYSIEMGDVYFVVAAVTYIRFRRINDFEWPIVKRLEFWIGP